MMGLRLNTLKKQLEREEEEEEEEEEIKKMRRGGRSLFQQIK